MMRERENKGGYGMVGHFLTQCSTNFTSMGRLCGHLHKEKNLVHYKTVYVWYTAILLFLKLSLCYLTNIFIISYPLRTRT